MKKARTLISLFLVLLLLPWSSIQPAHAYDYLWHCSCGATLEKVDTWGYDCETGTLVKRCTNCSAMNPYMRDPIAAHQETGFLGFQAKDRIRYGTGCKVCAGELDVETFTPSETGLQLEGFLYNTYPEPLCSVITGWTGDSDTVVIPDKLNGYPVLAIAPGAFENASVREVTVGGNVLTLGRRAFAGCDRLETVRLPDTLVSIEDEAFTGCVSLCDFDYPKNWRWAGNRIFWDCPSFTEVEIPAGTTQIPEYAFKEALALSQVTIPEGITHIGREAFAYTGLVKVTLPKTLVSLNQGAFQNCTELVSINLPDSILNLGEYAFYFCEKLQSITLPSKLKRIADGCFQGCGSLETVAIPQSVIWICHDAFQRCFSLGSVVIPKSVKVIHDQAFSQCTSLSQVYYGGSKTQWQKIRFSVTGFEYDDVITIVGLGDPELTFLWNACSHIQWSYRTEELHRYSCSKCGVRGDSAHIWAAPTLGKDPTTQESGYLDFRCLLCDGHLQQTVPAIDITGSQTPAVTDNLNDHFYGQTGGSRSALQVTADGFFRVEALEDTVTVEKYDRNCALVYRTSLPMELPIFGGFCISQEENYLIFGQANPEDDEEKEVVRVVKYSANWTRIDAVSIPASLTQEKIQDPFLSMEAVVWDGYLYLYSTGVIGGYRNGPIQAAWTCQIRLQDMAYMKQWILNGNASDVRLRDSVENLYRVNLSEELPGDVLVDQEYQMKGAVTGFNRNTLQLHNAGLPSRYVTALGRPGTTDSHVLIPGVGKDGKLFVAAIPHDSFREEKTAICYLEDTGILSQCPPVLTVTEKGNLLLWSREDGIGWCLLSDDGQLSGEIYSGSGALSDCEPLVWNGKVLWYVTNHSAPTFYTLDLTAPQTITRICRHSYRDGFCTLCGQEAPKGILGDLDGNGIVNYQDALLVLRFSIRLATLENESLADFDGNGIVNYQDALSILRKSINLE